jgi:hypothetical protein
MKKIGENLTKRNINNRAPGIRDVLKVKGDAGTEVTTESFCLGWIN